MQRNFTLQQILLQVCYMNTETEVIIKKEQGNRLKEARNMLNLAHEELGDKIYHTKFQIKEMEFGRTKITLAIAKLLYYELGINPEYILEGTGKMFVEKASYYS